MDPRTSPPRPARLCGATARSAAELRAQLHQRDQRLGVLGLGEDRVEVREWMELDVDPLVLLDLRALAGVADPGGKEEEDLLGREAGRGVERAEVLPVLGGLADLLGELAL